MRARLWAAWALAAAIGSVAVVLAVSSGDAKSRTLRAAFDSAVQVTSGQEVRLAGVKVGEVRSVREADGKAVVELQVDDARAWPLHEGTMARLRWGTTVSYGARYITLLPGPRSAPALPDGGVLSTADTITPVEFDEAYNVFDPSTRRSLRGLIGGGADALRGRSAELRGALRNAPGALDELGASMGELGADRRALGTLATQGARTTAALARVEGPLRRLIDDFAATSDELATHAAAQQESLDRLPAALATTRDTLHRLQPSLTGLDRLVSEIAPGARGLAWLAGPATGALTELRGVAPLATGTLRTGTRAAPAITGLLREGVRFMPRLGGVLGDLTPVFGCLRPYAPEVAGFLSTWSGFAKNYDARGHYARTLIQTLPYAAGQPSSQALLEEAPGTTYAFPRPPGLDAGQAWLQPQCGAGQSALDATQDPEVSG